MENLYENLLFTATYVIAFIYHVAVNANVEPAQSRTIADMTLSQRCVIAKDESSETGSAPVTIEGINGTEQFCSIDFTRDFGNMTLVRMQGGYAQENDYVYVKRQDGDANPAKYVGFVNSNADSNGACCVSFMERSLTFYLHGNISLRLETTLTNKSHLSRSCPNAQSNQKVNNQTSCAGVVEYSNVIQCNHRAQEPYEMFNPWPYDTRCDIICRTKCQCTLGNRRIEYLCSNQEVPEVALIAYPTNVSYLNFSHNNLSSIKATAFLSINDKLKKLDFGFNFLISIDSAFQRLSNLEVLKLNDNNLTKLESETFQDLENLLELDLSYNNLETLQMTFQDLENLLELDLSYNNLETLQNDVFAGLHSLSTLDLTDTFLRSIQERAFSSLENLNTLNLEINELEDLHDDTFQELYNLTTLILRSNFIHKIQSALFRDLHKLQVLHLEHNLLTSLKDDVFSSLSALTRIMVNHNYITSLGDETFHSLSDLKVLILVKNYLTILKASWFVGLENLLELEVWGNRIKTLEHGVFRNLRSITGVHLQGNLIEVLDKATLTGLATVKNFDIYNNSLKYIQPGVFDHMVELQDLNLAKNFLTSLPPDLFKKTTKLVYLDLSINRLQNLPLVGHLSQLQHLIIKDNALTKIDKADASKVFDQFPDTVKLIVTQPEICICLLNNSNDNCKAADQESPYLTCQRMLPDMVLIVFMWVGGFGALFGNALVLFWRKTQPQEEYQVQKILIGNLALADLFMGIYMIIIASADTHYGEFFPMNAQNWRTSPVCRIAGALAITSSEASIMLLTVISCDRLIHIKYQMNKWKPRLNSTKWTALSVWLFALVIALAASLQAEGNPDVYEASNVCVGLPLAMKKVHTRNTTTFNKNSYVLQSASYEYFAPKEEAITEVDDTAPGMYLSVTIFLGLNLLCCVVIVGCYICIVITVFRSVSQIRRQRHMRHEIRMTIKVVAIIATDLCCWCPIILTSILVQADVVKISPRTFVWIVTFILPINSVINPYLYTLGNVIADRLPRNSDRSGSASRNTCTTNAERHSRPEPTNYPSHYAIENEENDFKAPLVETKPFVLMETCV